MLDDLDFFAAQDAGGISFSSAEETAPSEVFYMNDPGSSPTRKGWLALKWAIADAGGTVIEHNAVNRSHKARNAMFTRDTGVLLHVNGRKAFFHSDTSGELMRARTRDEVDAITRHEALNDIQKIAVDGDLEGGNLIYSPHHQTLFVGVSEHEFGNYLQRLYSGQEGSEEEHENAKRILDKMDAEESLSSEEQQWYDKARAYYKDIRDRSLANLEKAVDAFNQQLLDEGVINTPKEGIKVHPVHVKKEMAFPLVGLPQNMKGRYFYHLDNLMNVLPSGQVVLCEEALEKASLHALKSHLGGVERYAISASDAEDGTANFITVRDSVITPHTPSTPHDPSKPDLATWFKNQGYSEVITPESKGIEQKGWQFALGGFVRCATQKISEDIGFPSPELGKAGHAR